jgi:membrane associated rhomboid family serine protease
MLTRLIYANLAVFLAVKLVDIFCLLFSLGDANVLVNWLQVSAQVSQIATHPWTPFTYMFLHHEFLHILFNLLWFFWFGKIFLEYLTGKQLLGVYLLGGLFGAALYVVSFNLFPAFRDLVPVSYALGASAAVLAVVVAVAVYVPNYTVYLLFLGPVKIKYIALISILLDVVNFDKGNYGGHIAHIGGALFGYLFTLQLQKGNDITKWISKLIDAFAGWFKPKKKLKVTYRRGETDLDYNARKKANQKEIDVILEKIAQSGYESLSAKEKEILFQKSRNI